MGHTATTADRDFDLSLRFADVDNATPSFAWPVLPRTTAETLDTMDGTETETADITSTLQELVDRAGWASGNNALLVFDNVDVVPSSSGEILEWDEPTHALEYQLVVTYT